MNYSQQTHDLIERMCRNIERKDFKLEKKKAEECLLKTYDLFGLSRPKKIVWCKDIFDKKFDDAARSAGSAGSARSAGSAGSARSAWSAGLAWSAWSAWSAGSARSARSAGSALDYDFDCFVVEHEYCKNRKDNPGDEPNENDRKYLEYSELLMQAKEYGMGYRVEWEEVLYCVPTPLVLLNEQNQFHSITKPAIRWKGGAGFYFIHGVKFTEEQFKKQKKATVAQILSWEDIDQRSVLLRERPIEELLKEVPRTLIDETDECGGYKLYEIELPNIGKARIMTYKSWSSDKQYVKFVPPESTKCLETIATLRHQTVKELLNSNRS